MRTEYVIENPVTMGMTEDRWFEIWNLPGIDVIPSCLYVVTPDLKQVGQVLILDPHNKFEVVFRGANYDEAVNWLREDEFNFVSGRVFPDDGW